MKVDSETFKKVANVHIEHAIDRLRLVLSDDESRSMAVMMVTGWVLAGLDAAPKNWRLLGTRLDGSPQMLVGKLTLEEVRRATDLVRLKLETGSSTS